MLIFYFLELVEHDTALKQALAILSFLTKGNRKFEINEVTILEKN